MPFHVATYAAVVIIESEAKNFATPGLLLPDSGGTNIARYVESGLGLGTGSAGGFLNQYTALVSVKLDDQAPPTPTLVDFIIDGRVVYRYFPTFYQTFAYNGPLPAGTPIYGPPELFTAESDAVNFNALSTDQKQAIVAGADKYSALSGDDHVILPNTNTSVPEGWDSQNQFDAGLGNDFIVGSDRSDNILGAGDNDTIVGSAGNDILDGGA